MPTYKITEVNVTDKITEVKRVFVGGLTPEITQEDLVERFQRFGEVLDVQIKKKNESDGNKEKIFAYLNVKSTQDNLQKCFSLYNNTKWKGSQLKMQLAKENFMARLEVERKNGFDVKEDKSENKKTNIEYHNPFENLPDPTIPVLKGCVPGTIVPGEKNWVVGKYGRVLPIVHVRNKDKKKIIKVDPSKYCHNVKRIKEEDTVLSANNSLTLQLDDKDSEIVKKRKGVFPDWKSCYNKKKRIDLEKLKELYLNSISVSTVTNVNKEPDFEVVFGDVSMPQNNKMLDSDGNDSDSYYESLKKTQSRSFPKSNKSANLSSKNVSSSESGSTSHYNEVEMSQNETDVVKNLKRKTGKIPTEDVGLQQPQVKQTANQTCKKRKSQIQPFRGTKMLYEGDELKRQCNTKLVHENINGESLSIEASQTEIDRKNEDASVNVVNSKEPWIQQKANNNKPKPHIQPFKGTKMLYERDELKPGKPASDNTQEQVLHNNHAKSFSAKILPPVQESGIHSVKGLKEIKSSEKLVKNKNIVDNIPRVSGNKDVGLTKSSKNDEDGNISASSADTDEIIKRSKCMSPDEKNFHDVFEFDKIEFKPKGKVSSALKVSVADEFSSGLVKGEIPLVDVSSDDYSADDSEESDFEKFAEKESQKIKEMKDRNVNTPKSLVAEKLENNHLTKNIGMNHVKNAIQVKMDSRINLPVNNKSVDSDSTDSEIDAGDSENEKGNLKMKDNKTENNIQKKTMYKESDKNDSGSNVCDSVTKDTDTEHSSNVESDLDSNENDIKSSGDFGSDSDSNESDSVTKETNASRSEVDSDSKSNENDSVTKETDTSRSDTGSSDIDSESDNDESNLDTLNLEKFQNKTSVELSKCAKVDEKKTKSVKLGENNNLIATNTEQTNLASTNNKDLQRKHDLDTNKKRLESVMQRQKENLAQKSAIQKALSNIDNTGAPNKKIIFDDSDSDISQSNVQGLVTKELSKEDTSSSDEEVVGRKTKEKTGPALFDSTDEESSESDKDMFKIRPEFEGKSGQKRMELQSRYGNDARFKLDERFVDSGDEDQDASEIPEEDEKTKSLKILEEVVGSKIHTDKRGKTYRDLPLHFDPTNDAHLEYEVKDLEKTKKIKKNTKSKENKKEKSDEDKIDELPEVGKETFFEISESLKNAFKPSSTTSAEPQPFSLLSAFGTYGAEETDSEDNEEETGVKTLKHKSHMFSWQQQFDDESSDSERQGDESDESNEEQDQKKPVVFNSFKGFFFFQENDDRITEGIKSFCRQESLDVIRGKWLEKRSDLVEAYRRKHKRLLKKTKADEKQSKKTLTPRRR